MRLKEKLEGMLGKYTGTYPEQERVLKGEIGYLIQCRIQEGRIKAVSVTFDIG